MKMIFNTDYRSNLTYYFFIQYTLAVKWSHVKKYFWQVIEMINSKWQISLPFPEAYSEPIQTSK